MVFLHPVLLLVNNPYTLLLLNPITAPWRAQAGIIGLAALILIAITSVLRKEIKMDYNAWHGIHDLLALAIAVFALIHLVKGQLLYGRSGHADLLDHRGGDLDRITFYVRIFKPLADYRNGLTRSARSSQKLPDTWTMILKPDGHDGLDFNAGQVAWLNINTSPFTLHRNPFSISGSAHQKDDPALSRSRMR